MFTAIVVLSTVLLSPSFTSSQIQQSQVDPHLQLFEKWRKSIEFVGLGTLDDQALEYHEALVSESEKKQPTNNPNQKSRLIREDRPSGNERFSVVMLLDSECNISPFWKEFCRNVPDFAVIYEGEKLPILAIREIPKDDIRKGLRLVRAMFFLLEEMPDFQCPEGTTEEEAKFMEHAAKKVAADKLVVKLTEALSQKGLLK